jgi:hypothetical protein
MTTSVEIFEEALRATAEERDEFERKLLKCQVALGHVARAVRGRVVTDGWIDDSVLTEIIQNCYKVDANDYALQATTK